jgi:hypothetical protein
MAAARRISPDDEVRISDVIARASGTAIDLSLADAQALLGLIDEVRALRAELADCQANTPWLAELHAHCTRAGVPMGGIGERIGALTEKLVAARIRAESEPDADCFRLGDEWESPSGCIYTVSRIDLHPTPHGAVKFATLKRGDGSGKPLVREWDSIFRGGRYWIRRSWGGSA